APVLEGSGGVEPLKLQVEIEPQLGSEPGCRDQRGVALQQRHHGGRFAYGQESLILPDDTLPAGHMHTSRTERAATPSSQKPPSGRPRPSPSTRPRPRPAPGTAPAAWGPGPSCRGGAPLRRRRRPPCRPPPG